MKRTLTILSQNLAHGMLAWLPSEQRRRKIGESFRALEHALAAHDADVVCVQELATEAALDLDGFSWVHRVSSRGMDLAIASRVPLSAPGGAPFPRSGVGKAVAWSTAHADDFELRVGSVHLAVLSPFARRRQLAHAVSIANTDGVPMFLVGDTNEPRVRVVDEWARPHGLFTREPGATFPAQMPALRLDRALYTAGVDVTESAVSPRGTSDHRAVFFEVLAAAPESRRTIEGA
jgi:endonuclease/exonuclease/phosphatase family metal-dependent hydrolase